MEAVRLFEYAPEVPDQFASPTTLPTIRVGATSETRTFKVPAKSYATFPGRVVVLGYGGVAQAFLPLLLKHIRIDMARVQILTIEHVDDAFLRQVGLRTLTRRITSANLAPELDAVLGAGDLLINLTTGVSSLALLQYCQAVGALYIDTALEPWAGSFQERPSGYQLRKVALSMRRPARATAVLTHGANPGLVSHFVKAALTTLQATSNIKALPSTREGWGGLARALGVKVIQVVEIDTQRSNVRKKTNEFVNTWSAIGFAAEAAAHPELGWGTHELSQPVDGRVQDPLARSSIELTGRGAQTSVATWSPLRGEFSGFLIPHNEALSISEYLTIKDDDGEYRPTVYYAYRPSPDAVLSLQELARRDWELQPSTRVAIADVNSGVDELGVLLITDTRAIWHGSRLAASEAKKLVPTSNATTLQVAAGVLAATVWAIENPRRGIVEAEDLDHRRVIEIGRTYLGEIITTVTDWRPAAGVSSARDGAACQFGTFRLD